MAKKQAPAQRKRRTREHILADLSAHHVEGFALRCGFSVERVEHDYGIDLILFTYNAAGECEPGNVFVQLKATDHLKVAAGGQRIVFRIDRADLLAWLGQTMPVVLVVYDGKADRAYWLYVQAHFEKQPGFDPDRAGEQVAVHLPRGNSLDEAAIRRFAEFRERVCRQAGKVVRHEE